MLSLIEWRREIFKIYSDVRLERNGPLAWKKWKTKREKLFKYHPESPTFNVKRKSGFNPSPILYSYNPNFCLSSKYRILESSVILEIVTDENSITRIQPFLKTTDLQPKLNDTDQFLYEFYKVKNLNTLSKKYVFYKSLS